MARFKLTNKAVEDLENIWNYTFDKWSEEQADKYYNTLIESFKEIANHPKMGKSYDGIATNILGVKAYRHIIFYRLLNESYVEIIRILHQRMDLKKRIIE